MLNAREMLKEERKNMHELEDCYFRQTHRITREEMPQNLGSGRRVGFNS